MRKEYVKPVMESEEFVSNEYVAACWTVACNECLGKEKGYENLKSGVTTEKFLGKEMSIYQNSLGGETPCQTYKIPSTEPEFSLRNPWPWLLWQIFVELLDFNPGYSGSVSYHSVSVTEGWDNHPNASV